VTGALELNVAAQLERIKLNMYDSEAETKIRECRPGLLQRTSADRLETIWQIATWIKERSKEISRS